MVGWWQLMGSCCGHESRNIVECMHTAIEKTPNETPTCCIWTTTTVLNWSNPKPLLWLNRGPFNHWLLTSNHQPQGAASMVQAPNMVTWWARIHKAITWWLFVDYFMVFVTHFMGVIIIHSFPFIWNTPILWSQICDFIPFQAMVYGWCLIWTREGMSSGIAQKQQQKSMPQSLVAVFMLLMVLLRKSAGNIIYIYTYVLGDS